MPIQPKIPVNTRHPRRPPYLPYQMPHAPSPFQPKNVLFSRKPIKSCHSGDRGICFPHAPTADDQRLMTNDQRRLTHCSNKIGCTPIATLWPALTVVVPPPKSR